MFRTNNTIFSRTDRDTDKERDSGGDKNPIMLLSHQIMLCRRKKEEKKKRKKEKKTGWEKKRKKEESHSGEVQSKTQISSIISSFPENHSRKITLVASAKGGRSGVPFAW